MARIALVECNSKDYLNVYALIKMPRGIPLLAAILQKDGPHDVTCYVESIKRFNWRELLGYDLIGFSIITCTSNPTYEMIGKLRSAGYKGTIIVGGPHATAIPNEAINAGADIVVRNEGDKTIPQVVNAIQKKESLFGVPGITWRNGGLIRHNPDQPFLTEEELSDLPLPAFDTIIGHESMKQVPLGLSRSCPFNCDFCATKQMFGKYRCPMLEWRIGQLREFRNGYPELWQTAVVFFSDDNFLGDERAKLIVIQMMERMKNERLIPPMGWICQARVTDITPEIAVLMKEVGCVAVCLGIESADADILKLMQKGQSPKQIQQGLEILHAAGIETLAMTIAGADTDNFWSFFRGIRQLWRWGITYLQVLAMVPLPGTPMTRRLKSEGRAWTGNYDRYNGQHVILKPKQMTRFGVWLSLYGVTIWFYFLTKHGRTLIRKYWKVYRGLIWAAIKQYLAWPGRVVKDFLAH